jgi:hypothetical protein
MQPVPRSATIAFLLAVPCLAGAQGVRGVAIERSGNTPVAGVVVLLLDPAGQIAARALTNDRGEYRLIPSAPGTYRVRTLRIGYRPILSDPFELGERQELERELVLSDIPVSLDTVRVVARSACRVLSQSSVAVADVWEQVRAALTAADLTAGTRRLRATIMRYHRTVAPTTKRVTHERSYTDTNYFVTKPWRSRSADSLRRFGYTHEDPDGGRTYHAPDLDVLLSAQFVEDHCFRLANSSAAPQLIGIAFEPTRERSRIPDIRGTIWLDRASAALQRMDFTYVNTGTQGVEDAGGDMEFVVMGTGAWAISRWNIRMPLLELRRMARGTVPGVTPRSMDIAVLEQYIKEWQIAGGELRLVTRGVDTLWRK